MYQYAGLLSTRPRFDNVSKRFVNAQAVFNAHYEGRYVIHRAASQHAQQQQLQDIENPDLDEVELTQYDHDEQGLDMEVSQSEPDDLDPEGRPARLEDFYVPREGTPKALVDELYSDVVYGPPVRGQLLPLLCSSFAGRHCHLRLVLMLYHGRAGSCAGGFQGGGVSYGKLSNERSG